MDSFTAYVRGLADRKKTCTIRFRSESGGIATIRTRITGIETIEGREVLETEAGLPIRIDQLAEVDGRIPENYC